MISIAKVRDANYYLAQVASGAEDYYVGSGEAPGRWVGSGCVELGLSGVISEEALAAVLAGRDPRDERSIVSGRGPGSKRMAGFDLVCSAPKGVSLLGALGSPQVVAAVRAGHDQAVAEVLEYLEVSAAFVRRGHNGTRIIATSGYVAGAFRHRTSREAEPQLHTHLVVANMAKGSDGRWSALDGRAIYAQCRTAGFVYQAALRASLSARLGLAWSPVVNGMSEPDGFSSELLRAFSTRSAQIKAAMETHGSTSARGAQVAAWATRARKLKPSPEEAVAMAAAWRARAAGLGYGPDVVESLIGPPRGTGLSSSAFTSLAEELVGPDGLTANRSIFERRDVIRAIAEAAPDGAHLGEVEAMADKLLARRDVLSAALGPRGVCRWSTAELVTLEHRVLDTAADRLDAAVGVVVPGVLAAVLDEHAHLSGEQADMVRTLCSSGAGVEVVVGKAGSGKTSALCAARAAWEADGYRVVGAALAARAAAELEAGSGIASGSLARLLIDTERPQGSLGPWSVVVIDEAGLVGTRDIARLLKLAATAKVVLVGDPRQLPEVAAGGSFGALAARLGSISLTDNRRQQNAWEVGTLDELRHGSVRAAISTYWAKGRITLAADENSVRAAMVSDWFEHRRAEPSQSALMVGVRRAEVEALNALARRTVADAGGLGDQITVAGVDWAVGDEVVGLRNDSRIGITNGTRAVVVGVEEANYALSLRTQDGRELVVPASYTEAGRLAYGYALTLHKAQGATVDRAFCLGSESVYREAAYVGLSRARQRCDLYAVAGAGEPVTQDPIGRLITQISGSRAQVLGSAGAVDSLARLGPERDALLGALAGPSGGPGRTASEIRSIDAELSRAWERLGSGRSAGVVGLACERLEAERARALAAGSDGALDEGARSQRLERLGVVHEAMRARQGLLGRAALLAPPAVALSSLGPVPEGLAARRVWRGGAEALLAYRERWGVEGTDPLGGPGDSARQRAERAGAAREMAAAARRLGRSLEHGMSIGG